MKITLKELFDILKGGAGSGNWGHAGRPGERGGSAPHSMARSMVTGRDADRRQQAAKQKDFFKGNIKTASMQQIYDGSSQKVKDLADATGIIATDKASFDYATKHKDKFLDPTIPKPQIHFDATSMNDAIDSSINSGFWGRSLASSPSDFNPLTDFASYRLPFAALEHAKGYTTTTEFLAITPEEKAVASSLLKYETKSYGWKGARMAKALDNLTPDEQKLLKSYEKKVRVNTTITNELFGAIGRFGGAGYNPRPTLENLKEASKNVSPIKDNEKLGDYVKRIVNDPVNKQYFDPKPPPPPPAYPLNKMIALSDTSSTEKTYLDNRFKKSWDFKNHNTFSGKINNVFRIKNSGEVEAKYNEAVKKYGNVRKNLYHGTDHFAARSISSNGYIIPRNAKAGRMMGDGIYLADNSSKSAQYLGTKFSRNTGNGIMFVNDAAMGTVGDWTGRSGQGSNSWTDNTVFAKKNWGVLNNEWAVKDVNAVLPRYWLDVDIKK